MRLFVAVTPPPEALEHLGGALLGVRDVGVAPRWTAPALRHLTLAFLGEVDEQQLPALRDGLARVSGHHAPIPGRLSGAGRFPPRGPAQVLWIGVEEAAPSPLAALAAAVTAAARQARIRPDRRPYRPHLTVGRWRRGDPWDQAVVDALAGYRGPVFVLSEFALIRSHLGPQPRHEVLESWPLARRADDGRAD